MHPHQVQLSPKRALQMPIYHRKGYSDFEIVQQISTLNSLSPINILQFIISVVTGKVEHTFKLICISNLSLPHREDYS